MTEQNQPDEVMQEIIPTQKTRDTIEEQIANQVIEAQKAEGAIEDVPVAEAAPEAPAEPVAAPETPPEPELVEVKIEGQVFNVPKDKVESEGGIEAFQKKAAAEFIFRRAKEREDQANKLLAAARQPQQQPVNQPDNQLVDAVNAIRFAENPEETAKAIRALAGANQLAPEQIQQIADQRYAHRRALEKFEDKYPEIANDPYLRSIAANLENQELARGRSDYAVMLDQIGKHVSDWRGKFAGNFKEKEQKKSTITNIPQAKAKANLPDAPKELTVQEIIAQERRARKQA